MRGITVIRALDNLILCLYTFKFILLTGCACHRRVASIIYTIYNSNIFYRYFWSYRFSFWWLNTIYLYLIISNDINLYKVASTFIVLLVLCLYSVVYSAVSLFHIWLDRITYTIYLRNSISVEFYCDFSIKPVNYRHCSSNSESIKIIFWSF